jgi:putative ABC transport system substrate-binding protein
MLVILAVGILVAPPTATAQRAAKIPRIGVLEPGPPPTPPWTCLTAFQEGLRDLGYVEGQHIIFEYRYAESKAERLPELAADLVRLAPHVIWTHSNAAARAAKQATATIPIVVGVAADLVEQGLAASIARPGGNLTGFEFRDIELMAKRLELLKEAVPTIARVAVLVNPAARVHDQMPGDFEIAAHTLGVQLQHVEADAPEAFEGAFATMVQGGVDALMIMDHTMFARNRHRLLELALQHRLPTIAGGRHFAEAGSLMAYGAYARDLCQRSAVYVDKILRGARPADLPLDRGHRFELIINLKTAQALRLTLPPVFLLRADEVLE